MLPSSSVRVATTNTTTITTAACPKRLPKLPEIPCEIDSFVPNYENVFEINGDDVEFDSDEDIELLLKKSKFLRHSKSAHADLAPPQTSKKKPQLTLTGYGIEEEQDESSSDSDEDFYVHKSLLPFRKSKSSSGGFESAKMQTELKSLGTYKASKILKVIEKQTAAMMRSAEPEVATFIASTIDYWPPPEEAAKEQQDSVAKAESRRQSRTARKSLARGDDCNGFPLIPFGRTASVESDGLLSNGAWSAPGRIDEGSECESEIVGDTFRSWSAADRVLTDDGHDELFSTKKGISLSAERLDEQDVHEKFESYWKDHYSYDDLLDSAAMNGNYDSRSPFEPECGDMLDDEIVMQTAEEVEICRIDEENVKIDCKHKFRMVERAFSDHSSGSSTSSSSRVVLNSDESLHTPPSYLPSPSMPQFHFPAAQPMQNSKSDSFLKLYAADRPKTPLCGQPNPSNSTQEIYDPWHMDADEPAASVSIRLDQGTSESTATEEERVLAHCQMCPSPDCQQFVAAQILDQTTEVNGEEQSSEEEELDDLRMGSLLESRLERMKAFAGDETVSLFVQTGCETEEETLPGYVKAFNVMDEIPMADDSSVDSPLNAYLVKKFIMCRRSPPIASEDDLSDVEMTEIGSDDDLQVGDHFHRYNLSSLLVRKSHSDYGYGWAAHARNMRTDESVGNLNYWLSQRNGDTDADGAPPPSLTEVRPKTVATVKRSSTTSAIRNGCGNGSGGEEIWRRPFNDQFPSQLWKEREGEPNCVPQDAAAAPVTASSSSSSLSLSTGMHHQQRHHLRQRRRRRPSRGGDASPLTQPQWHEGNASHTQDEGRIYENLRSIAAHPMNLSQAFSNNPHSGTRFVTPYDDFDYDFTSAPVTGLCHGSVSMSQISSRMQQHRHTDSDAWYESDAAVCDRSHKPSQPCLISLEACNNGSCANCGNNGRLKKSATSVGFQGRSILNVGPRSARRILPLRPDFAATPEEPPEYANLPCSTSYHEQVSVRAAAPTDPLCCFFPTTSYNGSKEMQHENFAEIQRQMEVAEQSSHVPDGRPIVDSPRPNHLSFRSQSHAGTAHALSLADEMEQERRANSNEISDSCVPMRVQQPLATSPNINSAPPLNNFETASPISPKQFFARTPNPPVRPYRRTLPPLPIEVQQVLPAFLMSKSPTAFAPAVMGGVGRPTQAPPKEDHQICYGIEASMVRSASGIYGLDESYYEDGINGNFISSRKAATVYNNQEDSSGVSSCCTGVDSASTPTHRVQSAFRPRHSDELLLEVGDPVHLEREYDDHWCMGSNLRTGERGIFPSVHVCEIDLVEEICNGALATAITASRPLPPADRDTFYLTMLASIEVAHHKGNDVLTQSINKVCAMYQDKEEIIVPQTVLMEVSFRGIHIIDKRRKDFFKCPAFDFFYSLQNISFCGAHPKQLRYFGFITKHPLLPRFACHVFLSNESTQPIVESIGRAFKRSYDEYMAFAHPTEDIYIE